MERDLQEIVIYIQWNTIFNISQSTTDHDLHVSTMYKRSRPTVQYITIYISYIGKRSAVHHDLQQITIYYRTRSTGDHDLRYNISQFTYNGARSAKYLSRSTVEDLDPILSAMRCLYTITVLYQYITHILEAAPDLVPRIVQCVW